jgi:hypothetical protein
MKRRIRIYLIIFVILLVTAVFLPAVIRTVSDYFQGGQHYYYPHDLQRGDYLEHREQK